MKRFCFWSCLLFAPVVQVLALPNPAAQYAAILGYEYQRVQTSAGEKGVVIVKPGVQFDAWDFFKGKVGQEYSFGALCGYDTECVRTNIGSYVVEYAVCAPKGGKYLKHGDRISQAELMEQKGLPLFDKTPNQEKKIRRNPGLPQNQEENMLGIYGVMAHDLALPAIFDWRTNNLHSYIGPIHDQAVANCGSCYAFAAAAAAEGTYNWYNGRYDDNCVNFSESFIMWCLGRLPEYSPHFYGCAGADDYDYLELTALTTHGICLESAFPYTTTDPGSCEHWSDPRAIFFTWNRIPCNDIDAIKTAMMTYGVLDSAVLMDDNFMNYSGGIYSNSDVACNADPCYYAWTDHAISLVGWDDNPPGGGEGYWILRNSFGTSWGENGYMRIRYTSAKVACSTAHLIYLGTNTHTLSVASGYGGASPSVGCATNHHGTSIVCAVTNSPLLNGTTQFACIGWSGSGSIPATGNGTNTGQLKLTNDSNIAWRWQTNLYLNLNTQGSGSVDVVSGWQALGSNVTIVATPAPFYVFIDWYGDTGGCVVASNRLTAAMEAPRSVTANFAIMSPTNLSASAGIFSEKVLIAWDTVPGATGYSVWRSQTNVTSSAGLIAEGITTTNYNDPTAAHGTLYYYWIKATNASSVSAFSASAYGWRIDMASGICADYDGDGLADPAVYDADRDLWGVRLSGAGYALLITTIGGLGGPGCAAAAADYDGDGLADPAVYQELEGRWTVLLSSLNYAWRYQFTQTLGGAGFSGAPADYDGDRKADPAVYQRANGDWRTLFSSLNYREIDYPALLGGAGYLAVPADYDGDRKADPAVYGISSGYWAFKLSGLGYVELIPEQPFGGAGYLAVPADYDGDRKADPAIKNDTGNEWTVLFSSGGYTPVSLTIPFE